jgi:hypothetical protein
MNLKLLIRVAVYLLVYLGVPVIAGSVSNQTIGAVLGIVYIFLLIPWGILRAIDFYRNNNATTLFSRIFNALFRVPLALFGLTCLLAGLSIIGWVLYNILVERQKEYSGPNFILGLGSFGVGVPLVLYGWFTLQSAVRRREKIILSPEEQKELEHEEDDEENAAKNGGH